MVRLELSSGLCHNVDDLVTMNIAKLEALRDIAIDDELYETIGDIDNSLESARNFKIFSKS